jgi:hypothetical protein
VTYWLRLFTYFTLSDVDDCASYAVTFFHGMISDTNYYFPTYFQGAKGTSAIRSAVLVFPTACLVGTLTMRSASFRLSALISSSLAPSSIASGRLIARSGAYLLQSYAGWALITTGFGTLSLLKSTSSTAMGEGLQIVGATGLG